MIEPGVETQSERTEAFQASAEIRPGVEVRFDAGTAIADHRIGIVAGRVAHAAKPSAAGADMGYQDRLGPVTKGQIDIPDDASRDARVAVIARFAHRRDAGDELGLAKRPQLRRTVGAVHRMAFEKYGREDIVASIDIGLQLFFLFAQAAAFIFAGLALALVLGLADGFADGIGHPRELFDIRLKLPALRFELDKAGDVNFHAADIAVALNEFGIFEDEAFIEHWK